MLYQQLFLNPKENQSAVVLLHAFPLNSEMWQPQFEALKSENIPFLAIDYPGFGKSPEWEGSPSMDDFAEKVYEAISRLNLPKVVVVGLSMGGYVALSLYRNHPEIFTGLVLANTKASADSEEARQRRLKLIEQILEEPSMRGLIQFHLEKFFTDDTRKTVPQLSELVNRLMKQATPSGVILALQAMAHRKDSTDLLGKMPFPVLVVAGENDSLLPATDSQYMVDHLKTGELEIIPAAAHLSNIEQPEAFNRSLLRYLRTVTEL